MAHPLTESERAKSQPSDAPRDPLSIPSEVKASIRVLVVDDERTLRESCASVLQMDGYNVTLVGRGEEALETVKRRKFDIILVDLYMSQISGLEILQAALGAYKDTIVVVMTGNPSVTSSIEALRAGAWDYLPKPFSATHLQVLIGRASHAVMMSREAQDLRVQLMKQHGHSEKLALIGISPTFRKAVELARKVAPTDASVFISGESGTGKEVIAQFIHQNSRRASRALVPINCAALPEPLLESEMFGHRKGAFTGADRDKPGLLETANGGTLFLDELTEMSMPLQAKLLRVIQDGVVRRVGSEQQDAVVDVRFVSATNREPQEAVDAGMLRGDLFYRLRVVPIKLPPLRKRPEDIPLLANHFLTYYWQRHRQMGDRVPSPERGQHRVLALQTVARQRSGVTERDRACRRPGRAGTAHPAERHPRLRRCGGVAGGECRSRRDHGRSLSSREGSRGRPVREGISNAAGQPGRRQHVQGRAAGEHRPDHAVSADGQARVPPRRERRIDRVTPETAISTSASSERRRVSPGSGSVAPRLWDPDAPRPAALEPALWDALHRAVLATQAQWERALEHASGAEEIATHLAQLSTAIRQQLIGSPADSVEVPRTPLSRRLLGLVRGAFLEQVEGLPTVPESGQLLLVLAALEQVGERLEADWSQHFTDRLSAPDGLELVVEVAHDLRSPLTSILFLAETLQRGRSGAVNPVQERQLGLIYSAAFGLSSVASDVIELARGGDRLVDLDPIPFSVTDILESVRDIVQPIAEEKNLTVRLHRAGGGFPDRPPRGVEPGAAQPHHQRPQVHGGRLRRGGRAAERSAAGRVHGAGHRARDSAPVHGHPVRAVPAPTEGRRVRLLGLGVGSVDLPQAGRGDGLHPRGRDPAGGGHPVLLRAGPAGGG